MTRADEFQELADGLFFWQAYDPSVKADLSCMARRTPRGLVFIDPIPLADDALAELCAGCAPVAVLLTNGNHARAAAEYRARFSIPIHAHADAAAELGIPIDAKAGEGDVLFESFTVVELPGAGPGEIAFRAGDAIHLGDALIHLPSPGFAVLPDKYCADAGELRRSLGKLLRFPFEILTFAHGLPIVDRARQRLAELLA